jgi:hypothetical protein
MILYVFIDHRILFIVAVSAHNVRHLNQVTDCDVLNLDRLVYMVLTFCDSGVLSLLSQFRKLCLRLQVKRRRIRRDVR